MSLKTFSEVFTSILLPKTVDEIALYSKIEKIAYRETHSDADIFIVCSRLADKMTLLRAEKELNAALEMPVRFHIKERYVLPERIFQTEQIFTEYLPSIIFELSGKDKTANRFLSCAKFRFSSPECLQASFRDHLITRASGDSWLREIRRIFKERFDISFTYQIDYLAPEAEETPEENFVTAEEIPASEDGFPLENPTSGNEDFIPEETLIRENGITKPESGVFPPDIYPEDFIPAENKDTSPEDLPVPENTGAPEECNGNTTEKSDKKSEKKTDRSATPLRKGNPKQRKGSVLKNESGDPNLLYGRPFSDEIHKISDYENEEEATVVIQGTIFAVEEKEIRNEKVIYLISLSDGTDSITAKVFFKKDEMEKIRKILSVGTSVRLKGLARIDEFSKEYQVGNISGIYKSDFSMKNPRTDHAAEKRVELHAHTIFSENDGLTQLEEYFDAALRWGHDSIAITDHGGIYAIPGVHKFLSKLKENPYKDIKVIYGMEGYLVDDTLNLVENPCELPLNGPSVVFDLETTGLSPVNNKIIEIGAVKIENGEIVDRFSHFVNPGIPIPYHIEKLTGITNDMVVNAEDIREVLPDFLKFIDGAYLVAHNARFDLGFLKQNLDEIFPGINSDFSAVDTLPLSRYLFPNENKFSLDHMAKLLKIDPGNHHRAVDDANTTALIYLNYLERLQKQGFRTLSDLHDRLVITPEMIRKLKSHHVILLIKNETGRVNMNRIVSESSMKYVGGRGSSRRPMIPKSFLESHREGLIIGSACSAGELYEALLHEERKEEIDRIARFYDYFEIQPVGNNLYLLEEDDGEIKTKDDLREINKRIAELGDIYKKPVVATSDMHYLNPEDRIYRDIIRFGTMKIDKPDTAELYFRTTDEMLSEFDYLGTEKCYEVVVKNTRAIAGMVEDYLPLSPENAPPILEHADEDFRNTCYRTAKKLYGENLPEIVETRLSRELTPIIRKGYASLYMIARKLILKSRRDGYIVGSRGSVGSSIAAMMTEISEVNPLPVHYRCDHCQYSDFESEEVVANKNGCGYDLPDKNCPKCGTKLTKCGFDIPFETFLGFTGEKQPDIDLNFSSEYQPKAHAYTEIIFGKGQTFRAGTVSCIQEKIGKSFAKDYFERQGIHKRPAELRRIGTHLEGVKHSTGQHPGGIVVLPVGKEMEQFTPVQHPSNDMDSSIITTHFEYHSIEANLLKLDILGHQDPTMHHELEMLTGENPVSWPLDDPQVMSLFRDLSALHIRPEDIHGCTLGILGIPEFGTDFCMEMVKCCQPKVFSDLIKITGMAHGTDVWSNNNEILFKTHVADLKTAICCRDDILGRLIEAGIPPKDSFDIAEAVRKGKGLKKPEWEPMMIEHQIPEWYIESCKKIKYMFPKAHAAAYVMSGSRIGYAKIHYPLQYYSAYFSIRATGSIDYEKMCMGVTRLRAVMDEYQKKPSLTAVEKDEYAVMRIVEEMYARGFSFVPIDLMKADSSRFLVVSDKELMPSLQSISGLGPGAADGIQLQRNPAKPFTSLNDIKNRCKVSETNIQTMVQLGIVKNLPRDDQISLFDMM